MPKKIKELPSIRPKKFVEYIGQEKIIKTLKVFTDAVKRRGINSEHVLLYGPPGIGKTTLAHVIANELGSEIKITSGAAIQKTGDLAAILTNLKNGDILFIDEIHRLPKPVEEILYPVMEDYFIDIIIGKGPAARTVRLPVPKITIIGATTKLALLSAPLRDRFGLILRLDFYSEQEMITIVKRTSKLFDIPISEGATEEIAKRSRRTPRVANRILKRARDVFEVDKHTIIDEVLLDKLFNMLEIDTMGLNNLDIKYLRLVGEKYKNTPLGIETISLSLSEDLKTIEEFVEPYLLQLGLIKKTSRGRVLTKKALDHLHLKSSELLEQQKLV
ncbi:Holliday junction branch migration DNA helicase RuvB [Candidatus Roizmanbacteria bacterium]|nr:Holliday junction branch migration DNA helicase RuvB [Candidatus Roizmanbacteria bacterium]